MKISHMIASTTEPSPNSAAQIGDVAGDMYVGVQKAEGDEYPSQHDE